MRQKIDLMLGWQFTDLNGQTTAINLPHTWNNIDGQDGGNGDDAEYTVIDDDNNN